MTLKTVKTCTQCGSASLDPDGKCFSCGFDAKTQCEACAYKLDERGLCARCARVLPEDLEALKWTTATWTVCPIHGAHDAHGRETHYRVSWTTPDPRDKRKKVGHHEWRHRCYVCMKDSDLYLKSDQAQTFSDKFMIPAAVYQKLIDESVKRWKDRK